MISKMLTLLAWAHLFVVRYRQYPGSGFVEFPRLFYAYISTSQSKFLRFKRNALICLTFKKVSYDVKLFCFCNAWPEPVLTLN